MMSRIHFEVANFMLNDLAIHDILNILEKRI